MFDALISPLLSILECKVLLFILGYEIKWSAISQQDLINANIAGVYLDLKPLIAIFTLALTSVAISIAISYFTTNHLYRSFTSIRFRHDRAYP